MILISPESLKEEDLKKMSTSAGYVLGAIKYSANGKELKSYLERNKDALTHFPGYAAAVVNEFCNLKMKQNDLKKEVVDMCQSVIDIKKEGIAEGITEGIEQMIQNALSKGHTPEEIVDFMGASLEDVLVVQERLLQEAKL